MELADLFNDTAEVRATYKNLTFRMRVFTEKLTPEYKAKALLVASRAQAEAESGDEHTETKDETAMMVADLVESWKDEAGDDVRLHGQPFPPAYENLVKLSYPLLSTLMREITRYLGEMANPQSATS
jgi:alkanesulfonate monooxygenase SsuD/methylene tetrahydromethanopterin reductase-like flavin-dependent oxidoreductase (luciferase family)